MLRILCLHGPNLNMLGTREPEIYGTDTLETIVDGLTALAQELEVTLESRQSNREGELIEWVQEAREGFDGIVFNAASYTHTSIGLRDAIAFSETPCIEVHLSNVHAREAFRHVSMLAPVCVGVVQGFGPASYALGLRGLIDYLRRPNP